MKNLAVQQKIVLITNNILSQKQWCEKEMTEGSKQRSTEEQLEEACWNGLLNELLPEIMEKSGSGRKLFVWHIRQGTSVLHIQLSESKVLMDKLFSIDPDFFLYELLSAS